ncbi:MAG: Nucleoid-associated protein YejK [Proteobacteria bacterium]|nr:Nucleoid-associated protein YejK [Pseudomonadota bacterium]
MARVLSETVNLDIDHLHEAARVELGKWLADQQPYLSFIKKGKSGTDVSGYFRDALGCTEYTDAKHNTNQAKVAVEAYCAYKEWVGDDKKEVKRRFVELCATQLQAGQPVNLTTLSAMIDHQDPEAFSQFVRDNQYSVGEVFNPHKTTFMTWKRITKTFGSVKVSFDVQDVTDGKIDYDPDLQCLVIKSPPQTLINEILENKSTNNDGVA